MRLENVRVYNLDKAIQGMHYHFPWDKESDTKSGFAPYDDVIAMAEYNLRQRGEDPKKDEDLIPELLNILLCQDEGCWCEFCTIGQNDMEMINALPPWKKATLRQNIFVTMDIETSKENWNQLRTYFFATPSESLSQSVSKIQVSTNYQLLKRAIERDWLLSQPDEQKYFVSRIQCLPYAQELIMK